MKYLSSCIAVCICLLTYPLMGQEVTFSIDHPDQVRAGEEFTVTVTINKGSLTDYSRFSQDLPAGLTATNVNSPNADFSFDNQRIRIIWLKLPDAAQVKVSYNILVNERLKGSFLLGGVFAYVVDDERRFITHEGEREIRIIPSSTIDPEYIVDIQNFEGGAEPSEEVATGEEPYAMVIRQKPVLLNTGSYMVRLLVHNPPGSKYAKIEENIPSGYIFEEVESQEGIVSYSASTVKFIWMKLPAASEFELTYRLVPRENEAQAAMDIDGLFTYTAGNENREVPIREMNVSIQDLSASQKKNLLLTGRVPQGARITEEQAQQTQQRTQDQTNTQTRPPASQGTTILNTRILPAGTGVYFRVQVAATQNPVDAGALFRAEGLQEEVMVEQNQGMYKYTTGSFQSYERAMAFREQVERLPSVEGSFVVAYRDGRRVPVSSVVQHP